MMLGKGLRAGSVVARISPEIWDKGTSGSAGGTGWLGQAGSELWSPISRAGFAEQGCFPGKSVRRSRSVGLGGFPGSL